MYVCILVKWWHYLRSRFEVSQYTYYKKKHCVDYEINILLLLHSVSCFRASITSVFIIRGLNNATQFLYAWVKKFLLVDLLRSYIITRRYQ